MELKNRSFQYGKYLVLEIVGGKSRLGGVGTLLIKTYRIGTVTSAHRILST